MFSLLNSYYTNLSDKPSILKKINLWFFVNNYLFKFKLLNIILILQLKLQKQQYKYISLFFLMNYNFFNIMLISSLFLNFFFLII